MRAILLSSWNLVLYCFLIVRTSTVWTGTLVISVFQTVETELANLKGIHISTSRSDKLGGFGTSGNQGTVLGLKTYLISARTRSEVFVAEVEFLDAERTAKMSDSQTTLGEMS